jgi:hypothetical protein
VLSCTEEHIVIKFDDCGEKKFIASIVLPNLKKSDRQPPAEKRGFRAGNPRRHRGSLRRCVSESSSFPEVIATTMRGTRRRANLGQEAEYIWHDSKNLGSFDAVILPGGFSYGDYLRCGALPSSVR